MLKAGAVAFNIEECQHLCFGRGKKIQTAVSFQTENPTTERPYTFKDFVLHPKRSVNIKPRKCSMFHSKLDLVMNAFTCLFVVCNIVGFNYSCV